MDEISIGLFIKALHLSARQHSTQRRKDAAASAYINHPIHLVKVLWEVGEVRDWNVLIAALLHDTLEDTVDPKIGEYLELQQEIAEAFSQEVLEILNEVTDDKSLDKEVRKQMQIERAAGLSLNAKLVKLADKISNVSDIIINPPSTWTLDRKVKYLNWATAVVNGMRGTNEELEKEFDTWVERGHAIFASLAELEGRFEVIPGSGEDRDIL